MADPQPGENVPAAGPPPVAPDGAARPADPTRIEPTRIEPTRAEPTRAEPTRIEPTRIENGGSAAVHGDASTVDAPVRWSGSAAVPPPAPKKARWGSRAEDAPPSGSPQAEPAPPPREPDPTAVDPEDWSSMPAVDPWADQDTPWDLGVPVPEPLPPTRVDPPMPPAPMPPVPAPPAPMPPASMPPTRVDRPTPAPPPTRVGPPTPAPPPPTRVEKPAQATPPAPQAARPPMPPAPVRPAKEAPVGALPPAAAPPGAPAPKRRRWGRDKAAPVPANRVPIAARPPAARPPTQARPPAPPPAAPPRRKRRWPRRLAMFSLLGAVCCCGVPAYFAWPAARQYPVSATLPDSVADLSLRDDGASRRAVAKLTQQLKDADSSVGDVFAGVYGDGDGKKVTVFGSTGLRLTPGSDIDTEVQHLTSEYDVRDVQPFDLGEPGAHESCGVGDAGGTSVVVCTWADHGSLATVLLTRRSVQDSAELVGVLRSAVLTRG